MNAETFFNEEEKTSISSAIKEVEKQTAGEVAVMVVDESDTYPESRILAGVIIGGAISLLLTDQYFDASLWIFVPFMAMFSLFIGWSIQYMPDIKRFFTPQGHLEEKVQERALLAFYERGLYQTRDDTGVLFFISLFEHKVWVLADKGIHEKINPDELQEYADDVAKGIKTGNASQSLCLEIKRVGKILAEHFPIKPDDTNELSNEVITG